MLGDFVWNLQRTLTQFFSKSDLLTLSPSNDYRSVIFCPIPTSHISLLYQVIVKIKIIYLKKKLILTHFASRGHIFSIVPF